MRDSISAVPNRPVSRPGLPADGGFCASSPSPRHDSVARDGAGPDHGVGTPTALAVEQAADKWAFVARALGLE